MVGRHAQLVCGDVPHPGEFQRTWRPQGDVWGSSLSSTPAVSAIITTYRRPDVLSRAVHSVLSQTMTDVEVLVVDDEPSAEVRSIVEAIDDPRVRYLAHTENKGLSAARNTGIRAARGSYIAFLDDDDEWAPEKLSHQLAAMEAAGGSAAVTSFEVWKRPGRSTIRDIRLEGDVLEDLLRNDMVHMVTLLLPCTAFEAVGYFDESLFHHEDLDMALRLARRYSFVTVPETLTIIHVTPGSLSTNVQNRIDALQKIIAKTPEIRSRRRVRSRWLVKLARLHGEAGDNASWRQGLVGALRADPLNVQAAALLALGLVGGPRLHTQLARARGRVTRRMRAVRGRLEGLRES